MSSMLSSHGFWQSTSTTPAFLRNDIASLVARVREPMFLVQDPRNAALGLALGGETAPREPGNGTPSWPLLAVLPPLYPEWLGDGSFGEVHGTRFPYVSGAMANGIATTDIVMAMGRAGFLGFFGAAGLSFGRVEAAVSLLKRELGNAHPWGCNLIHSPAASRSTCSATIKARSWLVSVASMILGKTPQPNASKSIPSMR